MNFIIYKVKPNDTLDSISLRLSIPSDYLKEFHNTHCGKRLKLWMNDLHGISEILIPTNYETEESSEKKLRNSLPSKDFNPEFYDEKYFIQELITQEKTIELNYDIVLNFEKDQDITVVKVNRNDLKNHHKIPDDKVSTLAIECFKSINPIPIVINNNGLLESIYQHENLLQKFKKEKEKITDFHIGEVTETYLNNFEDNISKERVLFSQLTNTLLYQIMFPNLDWFYKKTNWEHEFVIYQNSFPLKFKCSTHIKEEDNDELSINISCELNENVSLLEIIRGIKINHDEELEDNCKAELKIIYKIHSQSKKLKTINAQLKIWEDHILFLEHHINIENEIIK